MSERTAGSGVVVWMPLQREWTNSEGMVRVELTHFYLT